MRRYGDNFYTTFRSLNVTDACIECESFTVISIDSLCIYENKYYLQFYLDNCPSKIFHKQMIGYLDENFF